MKAIAMKPIFAAAALAAVLAAGPIATADDARTEAGIKLASYHDLPGWRSRQFKQSRPGTKTAQWCGVCRNGGFYCFMAVSAPVGSPCFCPTFNGLVSCF